MKTKKINYIKLLLKDSIKVKKKLISGKQVNVLATMSSQICESINNGGKIMFCGNGGSAADAQHLAAELLIRLSIPPPVSRIESPSSII